MQAWNITGRNDAESLKYDTKIVQNRGSAYKPEKNDVNNLIY